MNKTLILLILLLSCHFGWAQQADSGVVKTLKLSISTPQPRLGETIELTIGSGPLREGIFQSLKGQVEFVNTYDTRDKDLTQSIVASSIGKHEIGPLVFYLDNVKYTTNKVVYEVIDPLPDTDEGLWFRKIRLSDTTFCIIVEQRIPSIHKTTKRTPDTYSISTSPSGNTVQFKYFTQIEGLEIGTSSSSTKTSSVIIKGKDRDFTYGYAICYFKITDRKAHIVITKELFENLPEGYKFKNIEIQ